MAANASGIRAGKAFVEIYADKSKLVRDLRGAESQIRAFAADVAKVGRNLTVASAAVLTPFAASLKVLAPFQKEMSRVGALLDATGAQMAILEKRARELGATTVFTAGQAAEAMSFFALAGFNVKEILEAIGPTLALAAAGNLQIAEAADITAKIMAGMGIAAADVGHAVDVLAKAMSTANTDVKQLGDAMKFVGPIAKAAGIGLEEIVAAIQLLSNAGMQGEMAGTALRGMLLALTNPSPEAAKKLAELGVTVKDVNGDVRDLADIMGDLEQALGGMGSADRLLAIGQIFDARQASGVAELVAQGAGKLREFTEQLRDADGTADRISRRMLDNLPGRLQILKSSLEELAITIGQAVEPSVSAMVETAQKIAVSVAKWAGENKGLLLTVAQIAAVVGVAGVSLLAMSAAAIVVGQTITSVTAIVKLAQAAWIGLAAAQRLMFATPIGFALTITTVALALLATKLYLARDGMVQLAEAQRKVLEKADEQRAADQKWIDRLGKLARLQQLTSGEMNEAQAIIAALTQRYGELGISINEATGAIEGLEEAQARMTERMREDRVRQLNIAMVELKGNIRLLQDRLDGIKGVVIDGSQIPTLQQQILDLFTELRKLQAERDKLLDGNNDSLPKSETADPASGPTREQLDAQEKMAQRIRDLRIAMIDDTLQRELAAIDERYQHERDAAIGNAKLLEQLKEAHALEVLAALGRESERQQATFKQLNDRQDTDSKQRLESVEDLRIRSQDKDPVQIEIDLLEKRRERAIDDLKDLQDKGINIDVNLKLLNEQFDLERGLIVKQDEASRSARLGVESQGIFNPAAIQSLQRTEFELQKRIASATERGSDYLRQIVGQLSGPGLTYGA